MVMYFELGSKLVLPSISRVNLKSFGFLFLLCERTIILKLLYSETTEHIGTHFEHCLAHGRYPTKAPFPLKTLCYNFTEVSGKNQSRRANGTEGRNSSPNTRRSGFVRAHSGRHLSGVSQKQCPRKSSFLETLVLT